VEDALRLDPNYAAAHAFLAWCHEICFMGGGSTSRRLAGRRRVARAPDGTWPPAVRPAAGLAAPPRPLARLRQQRAITNSHLIRDSPVMISSTSPSAKYSCSGSPLMFWNGRTAIEGLSGKAHQAVTHLAVGVFRKNATRLTRSER
jgi:hypothetical protein